MHPFGGFHRLLIQRGPTHLRHCQQRNKFQSSAGHEFLWELVDHLSAGLAENRFALVGPVSQESLVNRQGNVVGAKKVFLYSTTLGQQVALHPDHQGAGKGVPFKESPDPGKHLGKAWIKLQQSP